MCSGNGYFQRGKLDRVSTLHSTLTASQASIIHALLPPPTPSLSETDLFSCVFVRWVLDPDNWFYTDKGPELCGNSSGAR